MSTAIDVATATQRRSTASPVPSLCSTSSASSDAATPDAVATDLFPGQARSLAGVAVRAYCLGIALAFNTLLAALLALLPQLVPAPVATLAAIVAPLWRLPFFLVTLVAIVAPLWRLPFFLATLAVFHFLEFWVTAQYNTPAARISSFLLTANWPAYAIAHTAACVECLLRWTVFRHSTWYPAAGLLLPATPFARAQIVAGFMCLLVGQTVRTVAMAHAGRSFNHTIQHRRADSHVLVTSGIYSHFRHPSYFGFFWWAIGTQLVLGNTFCLAGYTAVLWRFFSMRIRHEETLLTRFFGDDYVTYKKRVGTKIPFI